MEDVLNYMESIDNSTPLDAKDRATLGRIWKLLDEKCGETPSGVKRHLNFGNSEDNGNSGKRRRSSSRTRVNRPHFVNVQVKDCTTWEDRLRVELDDLTDQYTVEGHLTHMERTDFHRALVTCLMHIEAPPYSEYEVEKLTVHSVIQVIFMLYLRCNFHKKSSKTMSKTFYNIKIRTRFIKSCQSKI